MSYESIRFGQNLGNNHKEGNLILKRRFYMSKSLLLQGWVYRSFNYFGEQWFNLLFIML